LTSLRAPSAQQDQDLRPVSATTCASVSSSVDRIQIVGVVGDATTVAALDHRQGRRHHRRYIVAEFREIAGW
jgi:hypothetical protein